MKTFLLVVGCFTNLIIAAQKKQSEYFLLYDQNWNPCKADSAKVLVYVQKLNDSAWQWNYYQFKGPLFHIETSSDENGKTLNGYVAYFNASGKIDSAGYVTHGLKNGKWYYYEDSIKPQITAEYEMGKLLQKERTKKLSESDMQLKPGEKEADFPGGTSKWVKYLQKNLRTPDRAISLRVNGTVIISFYVNADGELRDPRIVKSVEYSVDQEAIRMIKESPRWEPAIQDGKNVKAYRLQPITFKTE